jgi:hypothetical protein
MKLPFFYPDHPEFKAHVVYVRSELNRFLADSRLYEWKAEERFSESEARAKDIVLRVGSRPVKFVWLRDLIDALLFWRRDTDVMFEQGLEKWLREAIERSEPDMYVIKDWMSDQEKSAKGKHNLAVDEYRANLLKELGIDQTPE